MSRRKRIQKIVSGGQTGVDRAALDAALALAIPCGGWCPKGRLAEDGPIADRYPLQETTTIDYAVRTEWNVRDSDATLIINRGELEGGTRLTVELARRHQRPCLVVDPDRPSAIEDINTWLDDHDIRVLNVAGPRASKDPEIYGQARGVVERLLAAV